MAEGFLRRSKSVYRSTSAEYLEDERQRSAETRNVRLAAVRSFFRFLEYREHVRCRINFFLE
ncbi:hypothetical protein FVF58_04990 [Paraburkholderia panacisoli]|uniref:Core-binding (CB) domain-containing protein n=1 Tax=Paraburkholderia panacisoli TaxID=2603818 RepID=A0A5B0HI45_9BURK|nr:hypothetical protein FVF58_04990 [Paraburkholderia panacisoli]